MNIDVHVELSRSKRVEFKATQKQIDNAEVIIMANDVGVDKERFSHKPQYNCGTAPVVKNAKLVIKNALIFAKNPKNQKKDNSTAGDFILDAGKGKPMALRHLLSGCSFLISICSFRRVNLCYN